jgi:hypothetical protein
MVSSAINKDENDDKFHGNTLFFPGELDNFTHGAFAISRVPNDQTAID